MGVRTLADVDWEHWVPTDPATLVFIVHAKRLLLIRKKRGLGAGKVNGPGGRIAPGETAEQCAVRAVREELCITPSGLWEDDGLWLPHVLAGRFFRGRFVFQGDRMLDHAVELVTARPAPAPPW